MAEKIKRPQLWINSNLCFEIETTDQSFESNAERAHGQSGVIGASEGNPEAEIKCNITKIVDTKAGVLALEEAMFNQTDVVAVYKIGTLTMQSTYRVKQGSFNGETRTGSSKGSFTLINTSEVKKLA